MKITPLFLGLALILSSCQTDAGSKIEKSVDPTTNSKGIDNSQGSDPLKKEEKKNVIENNSEKTEKVLKLSEEKVLTKPTSPYDASDIENNSFAYNPFDTENAKADLLKTAYIKLDTVVATNPLNRQLKDTLFYFSFDDYSEISLLIRGKESRVVYASIVSNILPLRDNVALGMNKESFWTSFSNMENVHKDYNIIRVTNEDKLIWVAVRFQDEILKILEYHGSKSY